MIIDISNSLMLIVRRVEISLHFSKLVYILVRDNVIVSSHEVIEAIPTEVTVAIREELGHDVAPGWCHELR